MIVDTQIRTINCDGPGCENNAAFDIKRPFQEVVVEFPWLKTFRAVSTSYGTVFAYCSDNCLMEHCSTGIQNPPEERKVIDISTGGSANAIRLAAEAARKAQEATKNIKAGAPVIL